MSQLIKDLILKNRSYRRFFQNHKIKIETLISFIDLARLSPSAKNQQPLKYILVNSEIENKKVYETLSWAGFLKDWAGPTEGEKPSAYIIMLLDTEITDNNYCDHGIATQSILLGAVEQELGGCIIAAIDKKKLATSFKIPEKYKIIQAIALGKPKENIILTEIKNNDYKYYRDSEQNHYVPKRNLDEIIIK